MQDFQLLNFVGDLFVAGTETTTSTLRWAILCLIHYPHCQQRLYEEIKTVVGRHFLSQHWEGVVRLEN